MDMFALFMLDGCWLINWLADTRPIFRDIASGILASLPHGNREYILQKTVDVSTYPYPCLLKSL